MLENDLPVPTETFRTHQVFGELILRAVKYLIERNMPCKADMRLAAIQLSMVFSAS